MLGIVPATARRGNRQAIPPAEHLLKQIVDCGADRLCVIIAPEDCGLVTRLGGRIGTAKIIWLVQPEPEGQCDAIFRACPLIGGDEPVRVILPGTGDAPEGDAIVTDGRTLHALRRLWCEHRRQDDAFSDLLAIWRQDGAGPGEAGEAPAGAWSPDLGDDARSPEAIRAVAKALGPWFHNIDLNGIPTAPEHFLGDYPRFKWRRFSNAIPGDLSGRSVLDIGCNGGFYSIEMKRRGAARVLSIDSDDTYLAQARFAASVVGVDVEFRKCSVYDVGMLAERFDIVLFMGVFYHLRHPLLALDLIHRHVARDLLVFQSMQRGDPRVEAMAQDYDFWNDTPFESPGAPRMHFIERRYAGDPTNWWIPNRACAEAVLRSAGFTIVGHPEDEVYLCRRNEAASPSDAAVYPKGAFHPAG